VGHDGAVSDEQPGDGEAIRDEKQAWREKTWDALREAHVARFPGAKGRIPNFTGAEQAARLLTTTGAWAATQVLKANPDLPQLPPRVEALKAGKTVVMAVPRLREAEPFLTLDPDLLAVAPRKAASIGGSAEHGVPTGIDDVPHLDLVICGSVCVNHQGVRIGKGGGYSDLEMALGRAAGWIDDATIVVTTVHPIQVVDAELPETGHDFRLDLIVTPDEVIECPRHRRPPGILWDHLDPEKIAAIPTLSALAQAR
jgi:5-formyltetrahydrofolate cyclo-ligase